MQLCTVQKDRGGLEPRRLSSALHGAMLNEESLTEGSVIHTSNQRLNLMRLLATGAFGMCWEAEVNQANLRFHDEACPSYIAL